MGILTHFNFCIYWGPLGSPWVNHPPELPSTLRAARCLDGTGGGLGLVGPEEAVAVEVEAVELGASPEELAARDVAVAVAIHPAKPGWALGGPRGRRRDDRAGVRGGGGARGRSEQGGQVAACEGELDVVRDL